MREIEAIKERGIYDIDVLDEGKEVIGLTIDSKRRQYYVITPEDGIINEQTIKAYNFLRDEIISKIEEKRISGALSGEVKVYTEEILKKVLPSLGIYPMTERENKENIEFISALQNDTQTNSVCSYR